MVEVAPTPDHRWEWENLEDTMTEDWRGTSQTLNPYINIGGQNPVDLGPGQYFNAFFPWDYIREEVIPATNKILKEKKGNN